MLTDITAHTEDAFKGVVFIPHQHQTQLDRDFAPVGAQAIEHKQLGVQLGAQGRQLLGVVEGVADPLHQAVNACQLLRVGNGRLPAVLEHPCGIKAQYALYRGADVVQFQGIVGGENHVADAFRQHPIALLTVAQGLAGFDLIGDVFGHPDNARDLIIGIASQGLLANVKAAPHAIAVTEAQLALQ